MFFSPLFIFFAIELDETLIFSGVPGTRVGFKLPESKGRFNALNLGRKT